MRGKNVRRGEVKMSLLQEFYDNIEKLGISREAIQEEKDEECTLLTFLWKTNRKCHITLH